MLDYDSALICQRFLDTLRQFADTKDNARTREIYLCTARKVERLCDDAATLTLADITPNWLHALNSKMQADGVQSVNARNVHFRNLRAVMNWAVDNELTTNYPFRKFAVRYAKTRHLALSVKNLQQLIALPLTGHAAEYRDIFLLSFCLIGMNISDLCDLPADAVRGGRIAYKRNKTHKDYDIKVQPEAAALITRLHVQGSEWLLPVRDRYANPHDYVKHIDTGLKRLIDTEPFCRMTTNYARHSWATIANNDCGASVDLVSAALGHQYGSRITAVYINPDTRRVDLLNRQVLDLVFSADTP